jgi:hypothetical protein
MELLSLSLSVYPGLSLLLSASAIWTLYCHSLCRVSLSLFLSFSLSLCLSLSGNTFFGAIAEYSTRNKPVHLHPGVSINYCHYPQPHPELAFPVTAGNELLLHLDSE